MIKKTLIIAFLSVFSISSFAALPKENSKSNTKNQVSIKYKRKPSIKSMTVGAYKAIEAFKCSPFEECSIWDNNYLKRDQELAKILTSFIAGDYALKVKTLNLENLSKEQIIAKLKLEGFEEKSTVEKVDGILGRAKDKDYVDSGELYFHKDGSLVKIKDISNVRKYRPQAYAVKSVLKNPEGNPNWQNEAFKVSKEGYPIPKGPKQLHGIKIHSPQTSGADEDKGWIDLIMEEAHQDLPIIENENNIQE